MRILDASRDFETVRESIDQALQGL
jgi:hypothetical protein